MHEIILGLGFGDEGKGAAVDWLCATRKIKAVIRYNGGPQAAHNVVQPDGRHHTFSQLGSGSFHGVPTHLSEHMMVNPFNLVKEAEAFGIDVLELVTISEDSLLVTPIHVAANRTREDLRGSSRHGSTGLGVGETRWYHLKYGDDAPVIGDLRTPLVLWRKLNKMRQRYNDELPMPNTLPSNTVLIDRYQKMMEHQRISIVPSSYVDKLLDSGDCVFEGAQGVLLDENYGFHPHTTWTDTTTRNAETLLNGREYRKLGITRTYHTRHGAGPFPTENYECDNINLPEHHNGVGEYQGAWRVGALDLTLLKYAVQATGGVDAIMVTHMDYLDNVPGGLICTHGYDHWGYRNQVPFELDTLRLPGNWDFDGRNEQQYITEFLSSPGLFVRQYDLLQSPAEVIDAVKFAAGVEPTIFSYGPTWQDKGSVRVYAGK